MERIFKYHGLGNDFVVLDRRLTGLDIDAAASRALCDRRRGVGGDGVLVLLPGGSGTRGRMVVHNADGSIAEMCGNGLRCVVKHLADSDSSHPPRVQVETGSGVLTCDVRYNAQGKVDWVDVEMGPARLTASHLPSGPQGPFIEQPVPGHPGLVGSAVSMGNPHLVLWGVSLEEAPVLGPVLEKHPLFPQRTNVEFARLEGDGLQVVVWERGSGLTEACGTGACAAAAMAVKLGKRPAQTWFPVLLPGGQLDLYVAADLSFVRMRGPVQFVFEGQVDIPVERS